MRTTSLTTATVALIAALSSQTASYAAPSGKTITCQFPKTGTVKIDYIKSGPAGVLVTMKGHTRAYSAGVYFLKPPDAKLPTLTFKDDMKRWALLNGKMEEVEVAQCMETRP